MELAPIDEQVPGSDGILDRPSGVSTPIADNDRQEETQPQSDRGLVLLVHPCMVAMVNKTFHGFRYILIVDPEAEPGVLREGSKFL
jgi:hypothetical protein